MYENKGYWKQATPFVDTIECSECGYQWPELEFASKYCPDCGAKMYSNETGIEIVKVLICSQRKKIH